MRPLHRSFCIILAGLAAPAGAVTPEEAQSLPLAELARRVLGEAGSLMIDVDRPKWPACGVNCLPPPDPAATPPLNEIVFHERPVAYSAGVSAWTGLCMRSALRVSYGPQGKVAAMAAGSTQYKVAGSMRRRPEPLPKDYSEQSRIDNRACGDVSFADGNFGALDGESAFEVVAASRIFADAVRRGGPLPFKLSCGGYVPDCKRASGREAVAASIAPSRFGGVMQVDCGKSRAPVYTHGDRDCYLVTFRPYPGERLFVEMADSSTGLRLVRLGYSIRHDIIID